MVKHLVGLTWYLRNLQNLQNRFLLQLHLQQVGAVLVLLAVVVVLSISV